MDDARPVLAGDARPVEMIVMTPLVLAIVAVGLVPSTVLDVTSATAQRLAGVAAAAQEPAESAAFDPVPDPASRVPADTEGKP